MEILNSSLKKMVVKNFPQASSYQDMSLVIAGYKGIYKGKGSINGISGYSFLFQLLNGDKKDDDKG